MKKLYEENDIKSIATSIRAKTGKSDAMKVSEMSGEIDGIRADTNDYLTNNISGAYVNADITTLRNTAMSHMTKITSVSLPNVIQTGNSSLSSMTMLERVDLPNLTYLGEACLRYNNKLKTVNFPNVSYFHMNCLYSTKALTKLDVHVKATIRQNAFNASGLTMLILRDSSTSALSATDSLANTPIASGTGYIYVPSALIDSYKTATNWSVYADQFRALEDYTVDGTTTGELDESKI